MGPKFRCWGRVWSGTGRVSAATPPQSASKPFFPFSKRQRTDQSNRTERKGEQQTNAEPGPSAQQQAVLRDIAADDDDHSGTSCFLVNVLHQVACAVTRHTSHFCTNPTILRNQSTSITQFQSNAEVVVAAEFYQGAHHASIK
jgi:hypothetical protein